MQGAVPGLVKKLASFLNCVTSAGVSLSHSPQQIYLFLCWVQLSQNLEMEDGHNISY